MQVINENEFGIWGLFSKLNLYVEQNFHTINLNQNLINDDSKEKFSHITSLKQNKKIYGFIKKTYKKMSNLFLDNFSTGKKGKQIFYDLFSELESKLTFEREENNLDTKMYNAFDYQYHKDKSAYLYAFSSFNLIASLINIQLNQNLDHPEKIDFANVETYWNFDQIKDKKLVDYLTYITSSYCFQYLRSRDQDFRSVPFNVNNQYNFSSELMLCQITLMTTLTMCSIILNQIEKQSTNEITATTKL